MMKVKATAKAQTAQQKRYSVDAINAKQTAKAEAQKQTAQKSVKSAQKAQKQTKAKQTAQKQKTAFKDVVNALQHVTAFVTAQNNIEHAYARICFTDAFKRDFYKVCKDFAVYYDRVDSFKISVADSTLTDCTAFKADYQRTEKTRALEFSVKADALTDTITEIVAQRLLQTSAVVNVTFTQHSATKQTAKRSKAQ